MQLSPNQKTFWDFFFAFPESTKNLEYFQTKDERRKLFISKIIHCKTRDYLNAKKPRVRTLMDSQHVKASKTLHRSARQSFCHVF